MTDPRVSSIAEVLVTYSLDLQPGNTLLIRASSEADPLIREVYRYAIRAGAHVDLGLALPGLDRIFFDEASDDQLDWVSPRSRLFHESYDALLAILAPANTREGTGLNPEKMARAGRARKPLSDLFLERASRGEAKWCVTAFPTNASAQDADMGLAPHEDFIFGACLPDPRDPIGFWRRMEARQSVLLERLQSVKRIRLVARDTDLTVGVSGRNWINCAGHENFPDGEVFTGPEETVTNGDVRFTYPAVYQGNEVDDVRLTFREGRIVDFSAGKGVEFLEEILDRDDGARVLGEFAIGTNPGITQFSRNTLFDEKIQGTIHMAVGQSYPESGGTNASQVHWDMVCDMRDGGQLFADDELIYENGQFTLDLPEL